MHSLTNLMNDLMLTFSLSVFVVLRKPIKRGASDEASDSEEELAAFCPTVSEGQSFHLWICRILVQRLWMY